jgi:outer membrane protein TolC
MKSKDDAKPFSPAAPVKKPMPYIGLIILAVASVRVHPQPAALSLTVDGAVKIALDRNLSLQRSTLETTEKKRNRDRSWNQVLPSLAVSAGISHPSSLTGSIPPEENFWTPSLSLSASLSVSTAVIEQIKKARVDYEAGVLSYEQAKQELEVQVRKLFYQILLLQANRELAAQSLESAQARYEQSATLAAVGQASRLDELSARVDLENQRPTLGNATVVYANALDSLKALLGIDKETPVSLQGTLEYREGRGSAEGKPGASLAIAVVQQTIRALEAQRKAAWHEAYIPVLRFSWNANPQYRNAFWNDSSGAFSISLGLSIDNLLPWSAAKTQIDALDDTILSTHLQLTESLRNQEDRIRQYQRSLEQTKASVEALKLNVELAEHTYARYEEAYRKGAADYQSLRNAGDSLLQAKNKVQQEQYNLIVTVLELEKELTLPFSY